MLGYKEIMIIVDNTAMCINLNNQYMLLGGGSFMQLKLQRMWMLNCVCYQIHARIISVDITQLCIISLTIQRGSFKLLVEYINYKGSKFCCLGGSISFENSTLV